MSKITQSAKSENCLVRIPGWCNGNPETVVLAHWNGGGMGMKHKDILGAYCCSDCHRFLDGGWTRTHWDKSSVLLAHAQGIFRTQEKLLEKGLLTAL